MENNAKSSKRKFLFKKRNPRTVVEIEILDSNDSEFAENRFIDQDFAQSPSKDTNNLQAVPQQFSPNKEKENTSEQSTGKVITEETKNDWKGLLGVMQRNQKEALKNIKNKPQKRGLTAVFDSAKDKQKKIKLEIKNLPSSFSPKIIMESPSTSPHGQNKVADIFLKPKDRLAVAEATKTQIKSAENFKIFGDGHFFKALSLPTSVNSQETENNPNHFDGNIIKLNRTPVSGDPGPTKTKTCPFYKKLPDTNFSVDAFNFGAIPGIEIYFLSHFHSDHYIGLTKKFSKTIVCSIPTGNLVKLKIGVNDECILKLQLNKPYIIEGSEVVLVDANHCPGSVMFIIRLPNGITYFHTGDFRYNSDMLENTYIMGAIGSDCLYLDTTYCDPKYDFPRQVDSICELICTVKKHIVLQPRTLIVCGSYLIGKERVYFSLAEALGTKVFGATEKRRIINALENNLFTEYLTDKESMANVHVMNMQCINPKFLSEYLSTRTSLYTNVIGIKPSGWQFSAGSGGSVKKFGNAVTIIGIPYSEHSSFSELQELVTVIKPLKVQPTVNVGSAKKRTDIMDHIGKWLQK